MRAAHFGGLLIAALAVSSGIGVGAWARPLANSEEEANADRLYRNGILPSGDGIRGGTFESWFRVVPDHEWDRYQQEQRV